MIPAFKRITAGRFVVSALLAAFPGVVRIPTKDLVSPNSKDSSFKAAPWRSKRPQPAGSGWAPRGRPRGRATRFSGWVAPDIRRGWRYTLDALLALRCPPRLHFRSP